MQCSGVMSRATAGRSSRLVCKASAATTVCPKLVQKARLMAAVGSAWKQQQGQEKSLVDVVKQELKSSITWAGAVCLPLANVVASSQGSATAELYGAIAKGLDIYLLILTLRVILTWFRNINWFSEPFATLRQFTDPFLNTFRGILPSFGGIDVSPMIGFVLLNFVRNQLVHLSRTLGQ
ncbi:hypothetical protein HYH03_000213 [Edaphochlamys debaryana]|uniref:Uncharacterized protein n=1 Tax=Edaphochlamys debaryana TaxID=47281 RepID=A0A835YH41_9CHLO|nr:hypothetical protein HYH03_000213 [Edaphochlamys debaryana]|eukprot:KAG2501712.1 hypothetical protein HYH03_000213 [Edaphochlamys debaryana]